MCKKIYENGLSEAFQARKYDIYLLGLRETEGPFFA